MYPTTCDTAYSGGIEISICTWSGIRCPSSIRLSREEHREAREGKRRAECGAPGRRRAERLVGVRRVSAGGDEMPGHATRRQVIAGVLVPCGVRAGMNAGRRRQWPAPHCLQPKSDGPHFRLREKWRRSSCRANAWEISPRWRRNCPDKVRRRHFGIKTTYYLHSHLE